jgi:hypothetical protein
MVDNRVTNVALLIINTTDPELIQYQDPTQYEPFVSVFLVADSTKLERNQIVLNNIQHMTSDLKTFCNPDECIDYITNLTKRKIHPEYLRSI